MARRTKNHVQLQWFGGINKSADLIPDTDLDRADDIVFATNGARKKREGFEYLDTDIPSPDFRSSSGTTRTLTWTTSSIQVDVGTPDDVLVNGELISVATTATSGNETSYAVTSAAGTLTNMAEVTDVQCVADVSDSLQNTYWLAYSAEDETLHYFWHGNGGGGDVDPAISGATGHKITYTTNDTANTIASLNQAAVDAVADFGASVSTDTVTVTNAATGICTDASDGAAATGFTFTVTTQGGHTVSYTATGSLSESSTATSTLTVGRTSDVLKIQDYWYLDGSSVKQQLHVSATDQVKLFRYTAAGARQEISGTGGPSQTTSKIDARVLNNKCIISFNGISDNAVKYDPLSSADYAALGGTPPDFFVMEVYLGRLWTNDKTDPDRLHYSSTGNPEEWNGAGDSGALDIGIDDGDSVGITAMYVYKNLLYVAKRDTLYRITGNTPETFKVEDVSRGIGIESHRAVVYVDEQDVAFISARGIHAASATDLYGDVESRFLSKKIQPLYDDFQANTLSMTQGVFIPELNSIAFNFAENSATHNTIYFYNILEEVQEWYRWPSIFPTALAIRRNGDRKQMLIGTSTGKIITTQNGEYSDFNGQTGITYRIKSGSIYPGNNPQTWKGFKRLALFFKPKARTQFTCSVQIDNQAVQSATFSPGSGSDRLGETFILGSSVLGTSDTLAPFSMDLAGHGRGLTIDIVQTGTDEQVEIYGFSIEYEDEDVIPEVI